MFVGIIKVFIL